MGDSWIGGSQELGRRAFPNHQSRITNHRLQNIPVSSLAASDIIA